MNAEMLKKPYISAEIQTVCFSRCDVIATSSAESDGLHDDDTSDRWSDP